jgi:hypothetical protein
MDQECIPNDSRVVSNFKKNKTIPFLLFLQRNIIFIFAIIIPWQIFLRVYAHIDLPLSVFVICIGFALAFISNSLNMPLDKLKGPAFGYAIMLSSIAISSIFGSYVSLYNATNVLGHLSIGLLVIFWVILNSDNKNLLLQKKEVVKVFLLSAFPLGVVGLVLFFVPEWELFWVKKVSGLLIEADSALTPNNILSIDKIGVVFMNTNVAAIFWGMSMWLALWMRQKSISFWRIAYIAFAVVFCIDVLSTGSRGGILALIFTIIISIIIHAVYTINVHGFNRETLTNVIIIVVTIFSVLVIEYIGLKPRVFISAIERTIVDFNNLKFNQGSVGSRLALWSHAFKVIKQAPVRGYGVVDFAVLGFPRGFPPHNLLLQVWVYGGLIAVIGLIWIFGTILFQLFRQLRLDQDMWVPIVLVSWVIIQAMFTNLVIGDYRIAMLLWLVVPLFLWSSRHGVKRHGES